MSAALFESGIASLPRIGRGKVRDIYAVGDDKMLIVVSDRLSAFDVVLPDPIPGKGRVKIFHGLLIFPLEPQQSGVIQCELGIFILGLAELFKYWTCGIRIPKQQIGIRQVAQQGGI